MGRNSAHSLNKNPQDRKFCVFGGMATYMITIRSCCSHTVVCVLVCRQVNKTMLLTPHLIGATVSSCTYVIYGKDLKKKKSFLLSVLCPSLWTTSGSKSSCEHEEKHPMLKVVEQKRKASSQEHHSKQAAPGSTIPCPPVWDNGPCQETLVDGPGAVCILMLIPLF